MKYFIGVDPGWTHLGYGIVSEDMSVVHSGFYIPRDLPLGSAPGPLVGALKDLRIDIKRDVPNAAMERFVYYKGVHNPASEQILMVTGQLQFLFHIGKADVLMLRAADWKRLLVRHLYKEYGFKNSSKDQRLDKEFSLAAAHCITGIHFATDHEADAVCLAYVARLTYMRGLKVSCETVL